MNRSSIRRAGRLLPVAALLAGSVSAQPPSVSTIMPRNAGPVSIFDLPLLLGGDLQFQMFDFEAHEKFCLLVGYVHEIDGQLSSRLPADRGICNEAGPQRLMVVMRPAGDKRTLSFGLHRRDTGVGGGSSVGELPIGKDISGWASFRPEGTIHADRETTLIRWRYGPNPPHPGTYHDVHVVIRLRENDVGFIGTYHEPYPGR